MEGLAVRDEASVIRMSRLIAHCNIGAFWQPGARKAVSVIRVCSRQGGPSGQGQNHSQENWDHVSSLVPAEQVTSGVSDLT